VSIATKFLQRIAEAFQYQLKVGGAPSGPEPTGNFGASPIRKAHAFDAAWIT
jgi:hypothetical protein